MLDSLILMHTYGQIIYSKETFFGKEASGSDISLTAGLISAIYSMTEETQAQKIEEIELEDLRYEFREMPGDRLFIVTVDKRMDNQDATDLLEEIIDSFFTKYGDIQTDGMILNDFEPVVDEIVERKLWYNTTPPKLQFIDYIVFLSLLFSFIWYPYWFINGEQNIVAEVLNGLGQGIGPFLLSIINVTIGTFGPILVNLYLLGKFPNMKLPVKYIREFITRPTRGGYTEELPFWFLSIPLLMIGLTSSVIASGRGLSYGLKVITFTTKIIEAIATFNPVTEVVTYTEVWRLIAIYLFIYFVTWYLIFPTIIGLISGNFSLNYLKSSSIVISLSHIVLIPAHLLEGKIFHELLGFNVESKQFFDEIFGTLPYLLTITFPINLFLFILLFYIGISMNSLVRKNKGRFAIGFLIGIFTVFAILDLAFFTIFSFVK